MNSKCVPVVAMVLLCLAAACRADLATWAAPAAQTVTTAARAPADAPKAVELIAPINGVASGQAVVLADGDLTQVSATCGGLRGPGGDLPASAVQIRYVTTARLDLATRRMAAPEASEEPLPFHTIYGQFVPVASRVQPAYVTVHVPPSTAPGAYEGQLQVVTNRGRATLPIRLTVPDFVLPDRSDLEMWVALGANPTEPAEYYQVPHYSQQHWKLVENQLRLLGDLGHHMLYIPVLWHANTGSGPQMVVFRKAGGTLQPDFTHLDRYLALAARYLGPQRRVILGVWGRWMFDSPRARLPVDVAFVTLVDDKGKPSMHKISADYAANEALWKAVYDGVAQRVRQHLNVPASHIILGFGDDRHPSDEVDAFWKKVAPESPGWQAWTHNYGNAGPRGALFEIVDTNSGKGRPDDIVRGGWDGVNAGRLYISSARDCQYQGVPPAFYFTVPDAAVGKQTRGNSIGLARIGLDYWQRESRDWESGEVKSINNYNGGPWTDPGRVDRNRTTYLTAPGPDGALPMLHYEAMREGIQAVHARIVLEKALRGDGADKDAILKALTLFRRKGSRLDAFYFDKDGPSRQQQFDAFEKSGGWNEGVAALYAEAARVQKHGGQREAALRSAREGAVRRGK